MNRKILGHFILFLLLIISMIKCIIQYYELLVLHIATYIRAEGNIKFSDYIVEQVNIQSA